MPEPFEHVSAGLDLANQGKYEEAVKHIRRGIKAYKRQKDRGGVAFALGRLGYCYEQADRMDEAKTAYERAVELGTDIPAIYSGLINVLVSKRQLDRAFRIAEIWGSTGAHHIDYPPHHVFVRMADGLARQEQYQVAQEILERTIEALPRERYPDLYWSARGHLGRVYERANDLDKCFCQPKTGPFDKRKQVHLAHFH
jgi:tetratricopeptide (TPR) repeat protein